MTHEEWKQKYPRLAQVYWTAPKKRMLPSPKETREDVRKMEEAQKIWEKYE